MKRGLKEIIVIWLFNYIFNFSMKRGLKVLFPAFSFCFLVASLDEKRIESIVNVFYKSKLHDTSSMKRGLKGLVYIYDIALSEALDEKRIER